MPFSAEGEVYVWGSNEAGQLGRITATKTNSIPTLLDFGGQTVDALAVGSNHNGVRTTGVLRGISESREKRL